MCEYVSKKDLQIADNKKIEIYSIDGLRINNFRKMVNTDLVLGKHITIVSGRNGSMKSTIMGLAVHPFTTNKTNLLGKKMETKFKDVFKFSLVKDDDKYSYDLHLSN